MYNDDPENRAEFMCNDQHAWLLGKNSPSMTPCKKTSDNLLGYSEAFRYDGMLAYKYLHYFRVINNLLDLQFFFNKLPSKAHSVAALEQSVLGGINFFKEDDNKGEEESDDYSEDPYLSSTPKVFAKDKPYSLSSDDPSFA